MWKIGIAASETSSLVHFFQAGFGLVAGLHQIEEIGVRQHRTLGFAGGARGIELDRDVLGLIAIFG